MMGGAIAGLAAHLLVIDPTGQHLADVVRQAAGNFFLVVLAILGVVALLRRRLLTLVVLLAMAALAAIFVYSPDFIQQLSAAIVKVVEGQ